MTRCVTHQSQTARWPSFPLPPPSSSEECREKCSKSYVFGRPKPRRQKMLTSEVLISFVWILNAISISKTRLAQHVDLERQRIRAENLRRNTQHFRVLVIGRANAGKTTILQRVCNTTEQPKIFDPQRRQVCVIHILYAIEWFYWQINLSELNPTAKAIKNFFVINSYSTPYSEECTTLRMKWYSAVTQDISSMTLVALKQVEHQSWMMSRASYSTGQQQIVWRNSYMQYGEWLSNDTQMYLNTDCLGTASQ